MASILMTLLGDIQYDGRVRREIQTLTTAGHHVELVVSDFTKQRSGNEDLGIRIHHVPMTMWPNPAMNFISQIRFNRQAASIIRELAPTYIHCHDLSALLAGVWAKEQIGAQLVFDAHELMPESMGGIREVVWGNIEKICIHSCDYIIMPEKNRIAYFKLKYPQIRKISLLSNFPRQRDMPNRKHDLFRHVYPISRDQKIILYTGLIAAKRNVEELIDSMVRCNERFVLVLLGRTFKNYEQRLRAKIEKFALQSRVFLHDAVPHEQILRYMASCDIGTAFYSNTNANNYYCASNKLYEFIALGKPVLTNNYPGLVESVKRYGQGVCLEEISPKSLAEAYVRACDPLFVTPGRNKFFWEDQEDVLIQLYENKG